MVQFLRISDDLNATHFPEFEIIGVVPNRFFIYILLGVIGSLMGAGLILFYFKK